MTDHIPPPPSNPDGLPSAPPPSPPPPAPPFGVPSASEVAPPPLSEPVRKRGIGGRVAAAVVGVVVLGGGLGYAATQAGDGGGASSPEAAAEELFEAISNEDLIGVMDILPAGERRAFQDPIEDMASELSRLGILSDGVDLSSIDGIDLEFEDLEFTSEEIGDGVARVSLQQGRFNLDLDPGSLPLGDELVEVVEELSGEPLDIEPVSESDDFEPGQDEMSLVAIEDGGSWRISLFYSIAEPMRLAAGLDAPDFGNGIVAVGHDSPEEAVRALLDSAIALDVESVIGLLPPDEMAVLHDYAPLFLDDLDVSDAPFEGEIKSLDLDSDSDGDSAMVTVGGFEVDLVIDGEAGSVEFDGECFTIDHPDGTDEMCTDDLLEDVDTDDLPIDLDAGTAGVATVKVDGKWYVSPTRTMLGSLVSVLQAFEDDAVERIPEMLDGFFTEVDEIATDSGFGDSLGGVIGGELDEVEDEIGIDDDFVDDYGDDAEDDGLVAPSRDLLLTMLIDDQGFTPEVAGCIADEIYAAGFDDRTLSILQTSEIPDEVQMQIYDIVDACNS